MAKKFTIKLPDPHPVQAKIIAKSSRYNAVAMGEGAGKTTLGIEILIASPAGAARGNAPVAWFAKDNDELTLVRRQVIKLLDPIVKRRVSSKQLELVNGNSIFFYSLDDERIDKLEQFGLVVVDDVAKVPGFLQVWEDLLSESLRAHDGSAWFLSNAYGKANDFYKLHQQGLTDPDWSCWQFDSFCNPHLSDELRAEAERVTGQERRQRFGAEFLDHAIELTDAQRIVGVQETFLEWCDRLEHDGLKVDGHPFTLSNRPAMRFIYAMIPSTPEEAFGRIDVIMKCTQVGFTVMEMLAMIYLAIKFGPAKIGMFMPSQALASGKSSDRFMPIVRTIPPVHRLMVDKKASGTKGGEGNVLTRNLANSRFHFLWTSGKTTTESNPMDVISFDEVQEMAIADMEKTQERMSASRIRYTLMGSTANWPDSDIHWWYKRGKEYQFHTECPSCGDSQVLDEHFPDCIGYDPDAPRLSSQRLGLSATGEYRYKCMSCDGWIDDPQRGEWVAKSPEAEINSVHFPQFLSPTISPRDIIEAYNNADDMKNFYNRKLGKPYTDPSQVPVNMEMLNECARIGMEAGLKWKSSAKGTFMGIDQMGFFNVAILKERMPDGRQATIHIEMIFDADPFSRCSDLMDQYGVQCCVVETLPNYNDAKRFAQRHPGKVFLAGYRKLEEDMMLWGDAPRLGVSDRRTSEEERDQYTVTLDQYKCMQVSMKRFQNHICLFPDPVALTQEIEGEKQRHGLGLSKDVMSDGQRTVVSVCKDVAFFHFTRTALVAEKDEEEKKYSRRVVKVGIDPHTSYANMLCDVAWARAHGTSTFIMPDVESAGADKGPKGPRKVEVPGTGGAAMKQIDELLENTCGGCENRDPARSYCSELQCFVKPKDPGCWAYIARS